MGRTSVRAAAVVTLAALFAGTATASFGAAPEEVKDPAPIGFTDGQYIVLLDDQPATTYDGGVPGLAPTTPEKGKKYNPHSAASTKYKGYLKKQQKDVAASAGVTPYATYQVTLNGFSATLTAAQAAKLQNTEGVRLVVPDEIRHPDAVPSTEFLGLSGAGGVWESVGGIDQAGAGTVVGVVDTGIAPENPSFAGAPLGDSSGANPYLVGNEVVFMKGDGTEFRSTRVATADWTADDYSTKLVGAQYFSAGAAAAGFVFDSDFLSPRDGDGHGSHTASTAAGNNGVAASVEGVDFGEISGVAPAAKVAMYKACFVGPDPLVTDDDICALSDLLAAIDTAAGDGVDVINYSIGGGSATTVLAADDFSFLNAAAAGIFVSVSAGNAGPGSATADHASPWYTTVAASTIPTYEGTVQVGDFEASGATVSVPFGETVTAPVVYAGDVALAGAAPAEAALCFLGTLDQAKVADKIVVCDRGTNARVEKSDEVEAAGGAGMILVNVPGGADSLDNDFHAVPTIHIASANRTALLAAVHAAPGVTASLISGNVTGDETPTPQIAGFSSRGPMLADGSDVLKPDVSAPGVAILAATNNAPADAPTFGFKSGTSMSSPHVAGLGALYLGERPNASPSEIKSALMTTAYDLKDAAGDPSTDPFAQGAGHVDPKKYFEPGLLYLNGTMDWLEYLKGSGYDLGVPGVEPIDPSDLNLASISIGSLAKPQTVKRTVTATAAGTYNATVSVPGMTAVVSPSTLTFGAAGESQDFTVTFTNATAPVEKWATGFLTWTSADTTVRSPIAIFPVTADAPADVAGNGMNGSTAVTITPGITGSLPLNVSGLTPMVQLFDRKVKADGHSGNQDSDPTKEGRVTFLVEVPAGATLARFDLDAVQDDSDLDLFVYHIGDKKVGPDAVWQSATGAADERVSLFNPEPGTYRIEVDVFTPTSDGTVQWDLRFGSVTADKKFALTATPNPLQVIQGTPASYSLSWSGLKADTRYLGVVQYGASAVHTVLTVDSGPKK